jgi:hypothetical protein
VGHEFVLAGLDLGDQETLRAQAAELVRANQETFRTPGRYQAADPARIIWVTVDRAAKLTDLRIDHNWTNRLSADRFPGALFAAMQTALLVETAEQAPSAVPVFEPIPDGLSEEE